MVLEENYQVNPGSLANQPKHFGEAVETRRWWILLTLSAFYISSAIGWLTFNATSTPSMAYFTINSDQLLFFTDVNMYMNFLLSYLACYLAYKYFKISLVTCTFVNALAGWLRYFAGSNYGIVLACQTLIGIVAAPLMGFATLIPDRWFPTKERFVVTTLSIFANYIGWGLGSILPCLLIGNDPEKVPVNTFVQGFILTVPFVLAAVCAKERPKFPPSYSALVKQEDHAGFWKEMKSLLKNRTFIFSSIYFGIALGISNSIPTTNGIYMKPLNLSDLDQGLITCSYVITGLITGLAGTFWIAKKGLKNYDFMIKILITLSFATLLILGGVFLF